jgi:hypothetical protein
MAMAIGKFDEIEAAMGRFVTPEAPIGKFTEGQRQIAVDIGRHRV